MGKKKEPEKSGGSPAWMATFADLATLLMAFFVLLLAFSEMDVTKYKAVAGSMKQALGVKSDSQEITLPDGDPSEVAKMAGGKGTERLDPNQLTAQAKKVKEMLAEELKEEKIELEGQPGRLIIRLPEEGVFASGSASLDDQFRPILGKVREVLAEAGGSVAVAGHTDDIPIRTDRFRSNWDLSAARAVSVVHELLRTGKKTLEDGTEVEVKIHSSRVVAQGYAESRPLVENTDRESRAQNRRVDIILMTDQESASGEEAPDPLQDVGEPPVDGQGGAPAEAPGAAE